MDPMRARESMDKVRRENYNGFSGVKYAKMHSDRRYSVFSVSSESIMH